MPCDSEPTRENARPRRSRSAADWTAAHQEAAMGCTVAVPKFMSTWNLRRRSYLEYESLQTELVKDLEMKSSWIQAEPDPTTGVLI